MIGGIGARNAMRKVVFMDIKRWSYGYDGGISAGNAMRTGA